MNRNELILSLTNMAMDQLTDPEVVEMCPLDYGAELSEDHLNFVWDRIYDAYEGRDDMELLELWQQITEREGADILARWMSGESDTLPTQPSIEPKPILN